jgi:aspartate-semialdehyde dehydrogenase
MQIAIVGATGLVGREMLAVLNEQGYPFHHLILSASERSAGTTYNYNGYPFYIHSVSELIEAKPEIALFSAGSEASKKYAPLFAQNGTTVIDNSSAWRMEEEIPLVVPEINADTIGSSKIIANPNCSTIQLVMVLAPLHQAFGLKRVVVSTYQAVSGSGMKGITQLENERQYGEESEERFYAHPIDYNCLPHCDVFLENDYTREEMKIIHESRKILGIPDLKITATAVRVPVLGGHSESVNIELNQPFDLQEVRELLSQMPGVIVLDKPAQNEYPMPIHARGKNEVFVGRIRRDESVENGLNLWIVADNLRKGAATNAVQIALQLMKQQAPVIR